MLNMTGNQKALLLCRLDGSSAEGGAGKPTEPGGWSAGDDKLGQCRGGGSAEAGGGWGGLGLDSVVSHWLSTLAKEERSRVPLFSWLWSGQLIDAISWWGGRGIIGLASRVVSLFWTPVEHLGEVPGAKLEYGALKRGTRLGVINVLKVHSCIVNCTNIKIKIFFI